MAQVVVRRPFREDDFADEFGPDPGCAMLAVGRDRDEGHLVSSSVVSSRLGSF